MMNGKRKGACPNFKVSIIENDFIKENNSF
jgi:hypothetical protein